MLVRVALHLIEARDHAAATISVLTAIGLAWGYIIKRQRPVENDTGSASAALAFVAALCTLFVLIYNFQGIHYTGDTLVMRGLFAIDLPYLIGNMPSLDLYSQMRDMHQNGLWFPYHDHVYRAISVSHQVGGSEYFSLISYSFPLFGSVCASISTFALFRTRLTVRTALMSTVAVLLLASTWGDHILTGALSPSYLGGIVYACAILLLIHLLHSAEGKGRRIVLWILLGLSLGALAKTKLPLFAIVGGAVGFIALLAIRQFARTSIMVILACLLSLIFAVTTSGSSPFQPSGDFVIGAPLQGYANQVARVLDVSANEVNAIVTPSALEASDLLFIPYCVFHFLRMIILDARLLLFVFALIIVRKSRTESDSLILRFGIAAITLGIALPLMYSPAWYPLAISFYTPEIAGMIALICAMMLIIPRWNTIGSKWTKRAIVACVSYGTISTALHIVEQVNAKSYVLSRDEIRATQWLRKNTPRTSAVSSMRTDLDLADSINDESFYLYGALSQRRMISEGAKYGALLSAVAETDTVKGLRPVLLAQERLSLTRSYIPYGFDHLLIHDTAFASPHLTKVFESGNVSVWKPTRRPRH